MSAPTTTTVRDPKIRLPGVERDGPFRYWSLSRPWRRRWPGACSRWHWSGPGEASSAPVAAAQFRGGQCYCWYTAVLMSRPPPSSFRGSPNPAGGLTGRRCAGTWESRTRWFVHRTDNLRGVSRSADLCDRSFPLAGLRRVALNGWSGGLFRSSLRFRRRIPRGSWLIEWDAVRGVRWCASAAWPSWST